MSRAFRFRARDGREGTIRPARPGDARACLRIVREAVRERPRTLSILDDELWTPRTWRRHRLDWSSRGVTLVAELGGRIVGQVTCHRELRSGTRRHNAEFGITVAREERGNGVGRALLEVLEDWAREVGVTRLRLGVFEGNERARSLYLSLGYTDEGVERAGVRFPEGELDVTRMSKRIPSAHETGDDRARAHGYDEPQQR